MKNFWPLLIFLICSSFFSFPSALNAREWIIEEEWIGEENVWGSSATFFGKYFISVPDEKNGIITGHGKFTWLMSAFKNSEWVYKKAKGNRKGNKITVQFFSGVMIDNVNNRRYPISDWPWGPVTFTLEDGSKTYLQEANGVNVVFKLSGYIVEKWRLEYNGYEVLTFDAETISEKMLKDGTANQLVGGLKVYWNISVDFKVKKTKKGRKYLSGKGTAKVTKTEPFSRPAGVYECSSQEDPVPVSKKSFNVRGSIPPKGNLRVLLPSNKFHVTIDCLLDSDALKEYLKGLGYTSFPSLEKKKKILRDSFTGLMTSGSVVMPLQEHTKVIEKFPLYGLERTLKKMGEE